MTSAIESHRCTQCRHWLCHPGSDCEQCCPALINDGKYVHTWLGISGSTLIPDLAKEMNLNAGQRGALVDEVMPNSPAEKAGLKGSDNRSPLTERLPLSAAM